jgi:hypothetical protein
MTRNLFVVGISIFLGLSVPQYFSEFASRAYHGPVHTHALWVKFAAFQIMLDWLLYNNCALLFSTILKFTWVSFCSGWWVQFNNILNIFFGSPIIITFIVALVLDNTGVYHGHASSGVLVKMPEILSSTVFHLVFTKYFHQITELVFSLPPSFMVIFRDVHHKSTLSRDVARSPSLHP